MRHRITNDTVLLSNSQMFALFAQACGTHKIKQTVQTKSSPWSLQRVYLLETELGQSCFESIPRVTSSLRVFPHDSLLCWGYSTFTPANDPSSLLRQHEVVTRTRLIGAGENRSIIGCQGLSLYDTAAAAV